MLPPSKQEGSAKHTLYHYHEVDTQRGSRTYFVTQPGETEYTRWEVFDHKLIITEDTKGENDGKD